MPADNEKERWAVITENDGVFPGFNSRQEGLEWLIKNGVKGQVVRLTATIDQSAIWALSQPKKSTKLGPETERQNGQKNET